MLVLLALKCPVDTIMLLSLYLHTICIVNYQLPEAWPSKVIIIKTKQSALKKSNSCRRRTIKISHILFFLSQLCLSENDIRIVVCLDNLNLSNLTSKHSFLFGHDEISSNIIFMQANKKKSSDQI